MLPGIERRPGRMRFTDVDETVAMGDAEIDFEREGGTTHTVSFPVIAQRVGRGVEIHLDARDQELFPTGPDYTLRSLAFNGRMPVTVEEGRLSGSLSADFKVMPPEGGEPLEGTVHISFNGNRADDGG